MYDVVKVLIVQLWSCCALGPEVLIDRKHLHIRLQACAQEHTDEHLKAWPKIVFWLPQCLVMFPLGTICVTQRTFVSDKSKFLSREVLIKFLNPINYC